MGKKETKWTPPRGVRMITIPACVLNPYAVQWRSEGKRKTQNFETQTAQLAFAKAKAAELKTHGASAGRLDDSAAKEWRTFRDTIGHDTPLSEVAECWRLHGKTTKLTVAEAIDKMTKARTAEGVAESTLKHYKAIHERLAGAMGTKGAAEVTGDDVSNWLASLGMEPWSVRTHFIRARSLFTWLRVNNHITRSPCDGLKPPRIVPDDVKILTVEQGCDLFGAKNCTESREVVGRLALEAFAGVRFSTAGQMTAAEIQFAERGIVLTAAKIKTRRRQFIDGLPDNLWAWLEWSKPADWKMTTVAEYMHAKSWAFVRAGVKNPGNALRHSFCSYHVAMHKDAARTSVILCHSSPKMLYQHYKGNATEEQGKAWFAIVPP